MSSEGGRFAGQTVIVTGGATGIGFCLARSFLRQGADVLISGRREKPLREACSALDPAGTRLRWVAADIAKEQDNARLAAEAQGWKGRIDVLVNNAAAMRVNKPPEQTSLEEWRAVIDTNVTGTFLCCREVGKLMIRQRWGKIVNVASMSGFVVNRYFHGGSYEVSKAAVIMLTRTLATEWAQHNINVNAVAPGYYDTEPNREFFRRQPELAEKVAGMIPLGRLGDLEQLAEVVLLLASPAADYMTGSTLTIDGGYTLW